MPMITLEQQVRTLGIRKGTALFVHSSIKAVRQNVSAEALITSLRAAVGENGTLVFPTFTSRQEEYFDPDTTASIMGIVVEVFRKMPGALCSRHPRHPVAAQGPAARELLQGHENAIGPCGAGTPFEKHARMKGQILLIGVDLNTMTLLHTAEALLDLPYLRKLKGSYLDANNHVQHITMRQTPGGHRGRVYLFEKIFRERGLIRYGQIGNARTMLMDAEPVLDVMIQQLRANPAAVLCPGDYCPDCVDFKANIRAMQLADLGADLSILLSVRPDDAEKFNNMINRFGVPNRFGLISHLNIVRLAPDQIPPPPPDNEHEWSLQPAPQDIVKFKTPPEGYAGFVYAPLEAARAGIQPFHDVLYKSKFRDHITDIFVEDGLTELPGTISPALGFLSHLVPDGRVPLGEGHAKLREIISAMRMRNFSGRYHLLVPNTGNIYAQTLRLLKEFFNLLP